jgi:acyl-coenzyme A thioesterase PaaI-like protein
LTPRKEEDILVVDEKRIEIPRLEGHHCFACGTANPIGLKLKFYSVNDTVCSDITLGKNHEGWQNMAHGGIITTLLDEVMAWTIMYFKRVFFVTRKMKVKYVRPVLIGVPLTIKGKLLKEIKPPYVEAVADIFDDKNQLLVRATGEFVAVPKDKLELVPDGQKQDMIELFNKFSNSVE